MRPCNANHCGYIARVEVIRVIDNEPIGEYCHLHASELCHDPDYVLGEEL